MILYATGFNAFNQLSPVNYVDGEQVLDGRASKHNPQETTHEESIQPDDKKLEPYYAYGYFQNMTLPEDPEDLYDFRPIVEGHQIEPPISGLFYTFIHCDGKTLTSEITIPANVFALPGDFFAQDATGNILAIQRPKKDYESVSMKLYPNQLAYCKSQATNIWPVDVNPVKQIVSFNAGFIILYQDGTVRSLGDNRFVACLGRVVDEDHPADAPHEIDDLNTLDNPIRWVAAGGWTCAAVTESGDLYIWGGGPNSKLEAIPGLTGVPEYTEVAGGKVVDHISVGESHAVLKTDDGNVYVIGGNDNGQLGLGPDFGERADTWAQVDVKVGRLKNYIVTNVTAGPRCSFFLAKYEVVPSTVLEDIPQAEIARKLP